MPTFFFPSQNYYSEDRWQNAGPYGNGTDIYSTVLFGETAIDVVNQHPDGVPLFMYLAWQAVRSPHLAHLA
jgi:hypothetical protein